MEKAVSDCLHDSLEELTKDELKKFKFKLNTFKLKKGYDNIPMGKLEEASPVDLTRSILSYYGQDYGVEVTVNVLKSINRRDLAQKLSETLRPEVLNLQQESETSPEPGEKDGLNQRLESEMQQDPEPRQKDDLNWEQESATQQDPELEETDLPKETLPVPGEKNGLNQRLESETQRDPELEETDLPKGKENENPERATAMASETPEREVEDEATCPICLDYFSDPVTVDCGHSSCKTCITTYCDNWEEGNHGPLCCPICREKIEKVNFRPNWDLAGLVEHVKQLGLKPGKEEKENLCERHKEKLSQFCEEDGELICVECDKSPVHKTHTVVLIKEAAQKYKGQICVHLNNLSKKKEDLLEIKLNEERQSQKHQEETETVRKKIMSEFEELEKILQEQREPLLAQLEELNKDIVKRENENVTKLFEEISFLSNLIKELKEKCRQPASEFLQGIRSTLNRCKQVKDRPPVEISPELEEKLSTLHQLGVVIEEILKKFRAALNRKQEPETQHATVSGKKKLCSERPKALQYIESKLKMKKYRNRKLKLRDVQEITPESVKNWTPQTTGDLPWHFLRKLMALNGTARNTNLQHRAPDDQTLSMDKEDLDIHEDIFLLTDTDTSDSLHPLDVLCAVLLCSDSFLQQEILSRMSMCLFALPLLLPALDTPKCTLLLWAMRDIVRKWRPHSLAESRGFREESLVLTSMPTISFVRLGSCSFSKSKLLNEVLSPSQQHHDSFIHWDMESGNNPREIADGLVEISWYFPAGTENSDLFLEPVAVTNLRGDIESHWPQFTFLTQVSSAVFIVTESISEREYTLLSSLQGSATKYYFIFNNQAATSKETLGFLKNLVPLLKLSNSHVLQKGRATNEATYVKSLQSAIAAVMTSSPKRVSIEAMAETARQLGIQVDEDTKECQRASEYAKEITVHIKDVAKYKREKLKLQGEPWKNLAKVEKVLCQMRKQGNIPLEKYKSQLKEKLIELRVQQHEHDLTDGLTTFITGLGLLPPEEKRYFLKWMKFDLDHIAWENLSKLRDQYKEKCKNSKDDPKMFAELDKLISASSLGVEHFMRELGQFYEAEHAMVKEGKMAESQRQFIHLPGIAADLMLEGFPMELIDGDASNIPLQWVTDVLTQLHAKLGGRSRMLVLTVLGGQSTGKSTLVNTMFGLQFAVSSGRCTRGAFMSLIKVAENFQQELGCDFILVIDIEGLKAPELAKLEDSYQHDNDLATLVIGLSDITIVNMAMENATEMKDILQIVVHAFLRMGEIEQKPSCQFVHQNVSDVSAHEQNMRDRKHLLEQLDEMTKVAAKMEKKSRELKFSDIIDYDLEKHNWYIPALWHGVPPMAPMNMGYSEKVYEVKKYLFEFLKGCSQNRSPKDIPQFLEWVKSLWNAVKHENFIFSFRNSLVAEAYNQLSVNYAEWEWGFRKEMYLWVSEKETFIQDQPPDKLDTNILTKLKNEAQEKLRQDAEKILDNLKQYFESGAANLHLVEKYKEEFRRSANDLRNELESYSFSKLEEATEIRKGQHKTDAILSVYKTKIEEKVDRLLNHCRKRKCKLNNDEQEREFKTMWTETLRELSLIPLLKRNIDEEMELHLRKDLENKGSAVWQMLQDAKSLPTYTTQNFKMKNEYLDIKVFKAMKISMSAMKEYFGHECWLKTEALATSLIDECNSYSEKKVNGKADYDETYCRELLWMIDEQLQQANVENLHITACFEVDLKLHILGDAARAFQKMHEEFIKENDPVQRLGKLKPQYLSTFKALYLENDECQDRAWNFCDQCLRPALVDCVNRRLGTEIVDDFLCDEQSIEYCSRSFFQFIVLKQLLEENDFNNYVQYTRNYVDFIKTRIQKHVLTRYKEKASLGDLETGIIFRIINKLRYVLKNSKGLKTKTVSAFLDNFCEKLQPDLVIPRDSLEVILFKNTASADQFSSFIEQFIPDLQEQVLSTFENLEIESKLSKLTVKPQDEILKRVFGCGKQCPFCRVPCEAGGSDHKVHFASLHRPRGLVESQRNKTKTLVSDICSSSVASSNTFRCTETKWEDRPYKDYQRYFPDWRILPDPSITASDYWKFVFKEFNHQFAEEFDALPANLPDDWYKITKDQALESLKEAYRLK
ncbi:interferon-induced very large GTPase 1-like [Mauremys mutica]|uniref:interferon-induced very large GTPase 1-like n=1 Tax=Mauremys mutica TaxID=74926 RepID=UPI001D16ABE3|nr:interferon-induced very large GTPase 1-like [Mauremys mutica]